jgi:MraZ protein
MFLGSYKIDFSGKNRLILPKKFRRELGNQEKFYVLLGQDGEIWGFDERNWLIWAEKILEKPLSSVEGRTERLKFFSRADECVLDNQGRFVLPQEFIEQVELKGEVLVVGAGDHFEIWDLTLWKKFQNKF